MPKREETLVHHPWDYVELDEMWLFIGSKRQIRWLWLAVSYQTRQILSFALGDRSAETLWQLWDGIPSRYRRKAMYTDHYNAYAAVIPACQHRPSKKGTGMTNTVERVNLTIRQRIGALVRKTLSFAKSETSLRQRLAWFVHQYNTEKARHWNKSIEHA